MKEWWHVVPHGLWPSQSSLTFSFTLLVNLLLCSNQWCYWLNVVQV